MPIYRVTAAVHASKYLGEFDASTEEEAIEMALNSDAASVSLCHACSHQCEDPECVEGYAELVNEGDAK